MSSFVVTCAQMDCKLGDVNSNLESIGNIAKQIGREKVSSDIVCFPELATTGYSLGKKWIDLAEEVPGRTADKLSEIAREYGYYLICGIDERGSRGKIYDSAVIFNPSGELVGKYRKVHLWDAERSFFSSGDSFPVFKTPFCTFGIGICYDLEFPESARTMAMKGARLALFPSAEISEVEKQIQSYVLARSSENCIFLAFSNRIGKEGKGRSSLSFFGTSQIASPDSTTKKARMSQKYISRRIDVGLLDKMKGKILPYLSQLEPHAYSFLGHTHRGS